MIYCQLDNVNNIKGDQQLAALQFFIGLGTINGGRTWQTFSAVLTTVGIQGDIETLEDIKSLSPQVP